LLFARPPVPAAARENWLLGSPSTPNTGRAGPGRQHGGFAVEHAIQWRAHGELARPARGALRQRKGIA
jgi:hypothetical protein